MGEGLGIKVIEYYKWSIDLDGTKAFIKDYILVKSSWFNVVENQL